jgi:hypothetical protein
MRFLRRVVWVATLAAACSFPGIAAAAPPSNDTFSGATVISSLPYTTTEDTAQATLDAVDTAAGNACNAGGLQFSNGVWFAYTPSTDQSLELDLSGSSYPTADAVVTGSPASFSAVSCSLATQSSVQVNAGTTYYIDVVEFGGGSGGTLNVSLKALSSPVVQLAVNPAGTFDQSSGTATATGTITCASGVFAFLEGNLSTQAHGRNAGISGFGMPASGVACDGSPHTWSFTTAPSSGLFKGGPVTADVFYFACNFFLCVNRQLTQTVTLKQ